MKHNVDDPTLCTIKDCVTCSLMMAPVFPPATPQAPAVPQPPPELGPEEAKAWTEGFASGWGAACGAVMAISPVPGDPLLRAQVEAKREPEPRCHRHVDCAAARAHHGTLARCCFIPGCECPPGWRMEDVIERIEREMAENIGGCLGPCAVLRIGDVKRLLAAYAELVRLARLDAVGSVMMQDAVGRVPPQR